MSAQGQQGGDDKNSMQILWIIFGIFMIAALIWWGFNKELKQFFIFIKTWELKGILAVFNVLGLEQLAEEVGSTLRLAERLTPTNIGTQTAEQVTLVSGKYLRYPFAVIVFISCYFFYTKNVKVRYKKRYTMEMLRNQEKALWPQIDVVSRIDLVSEDIDKGPWAMAQTPMIFAKAHNLLDIHVEGYGTDIKFVAKVDKQKAEKCFASQLGRPWNGIEHMAAHRKALLAVFIGRGCRSTKEASDILERLNRSIGAGKPADYTGVDELIKKHYNTREVQEICRAHAYETTVATSLLLYARQDGVLATADFLWLKPIDRRFWYTLNNVGRQTPFVEVGGVYAHWLAEKALGISLSVPAVKEAIRGLEIAINEIIYEPTPEERDELLKKSRENKR